MKWDIFKSFYPEKIYQPLVILLIILISYGQTLRMYFWNDDYTAKDIAALKNKKGTLMVDWSYNTEGPVTIERPLNIEVNLDNQWQNYQLLIPGGGKNLKNVSIIYNSFPGIIEIDNARLEYLK